MNRRELLLGGIALATVGATGLPPTPTIDAAQLGAWLKYFIDAEIQKVRVECGNPEFGRYIQRAVMRVIYDESSRLTGGAA